MRALVMALVLAGCGATAQAPERDLDWMSGYWLACEGGETAETWVGAGRGVLMGTSLSDGGFEFLRIAPNETGAVTYYAMPGGRAPPTAFPLVSNAGRRAVFENPEHDFPQRVIYHRDGETMTARIEGAMNGQDQHMEWRFARAELDTRCPG